ncbi:MAG: tyrosine-type recombinase/integrase [Brevundimonas sp.]|uniref:tyrosine-type recombinase/integrase n=1 Tax=Brevundimonas sp. TaxID=1871086 RepID=UPI00391AD34C
MARLEAARGNQPVSNERTFETLIRTWQQSQQFKDAKPRTQRGYTHTATYISAWSSSLGHPDPTTLNRPAVESFIALFDDRPTTRRLLLVVLRMVLDQAIYLGWRADNPARGIRVRAVKTRVGIWEQSDIDAYVAAAEKVGQQEMGAVILTMWEIGQRLTDVYLFRYGEHYDSEHGCFRFEQSKTDEPVAIPVSRGLRDRLAVNAGERLHLFHNPRTGRPWVRMRGPLIEADDTAASKDFARVREQAVSDGARDLKLKWLRHSCVVQLARAGCTVPEIAAITGHAIQSVHSILQRYLPRDSQVAANAQAKRGLM